MPELEKETEQFDILWDKADQYVPPQGAEALEDLLARVRAMLQDLTARHRGGRVLVATHGGVQQAVFTIVEQRRCAGCGMIFWEIAAVWRWACRAAPCACFACFRPCKCRKNRN